MRYDHITPAVFLSRPNRFIAQVELSGQEETVHVKNTGRCRELLIPGRTVWLEKSGNPARKTQYDLVAVDKDGLLINMDAQAPNRVFGEWARAGGFVEGLTLLRPETAWGSSRFDFYWEAGRRKGFVEVKGCTLEEDGLAMFPDAPTPAGGEAPAGVSRRPTGRVRVRGVHRHPNEGMPPVLPQRAHPPGVRSRPEGSGGGRSTGAGRRLPGRTRAVEYRSAGPGVPGHGGGAAPDGGGCPAALDRKRIAVFCARARSISIAPVPVRSGL